MKSVVGLKRGIRPNTAAQDKRTTAPATALNGQYQASNPVPLQCVGLVVSKKIRPHQLLEAGNIALFGQRVFSEVITL